MMFNPRKKGSTHTESQQQRQAQCEREESQLHLPQVNHRMNIISTFGKVMLTRGPHGPALTNCLITKRSRLKEYKPDKKKETQGGGRPEEKDEIRRSKEEKKMREADNWQYLLDSRSEPCFSRISSA
jgi:hypothetical protein